MVRFPSMRPTLLPRATRVSVAVVVALVLAGCSSASGSGSGVPGGGGSGGPANQLAESFAPPDVSVLPADHTSGVAPDTVVDVKSFGGDISTVAVVAAGDPTPLAGTLVTNKREWKANLGLLPGTAYTVDVKALAPDGTETTSHTSFSTVTGDRLTTATTPADGQTVGVGMPIKLRFNTAIPDALQSALVARVTVTSNPPVPGAWHWFSPYEVHYRPAVYWAAHTSVTVAGNLQGANAGNNTWGFGNWSETFTIGDKHVSFVDDKTEQMQVYTNDKLQNIFPVSMGKPGFDTIGGTLVVQYRQYDVRMKSCATFGGSACNPGSANYYDDDVYYDTAISTDGFFIHAAPWSVYAQGHYDVSHGCINISTANAITFFDFSQVGDVVIVSNTNRVADAGDGEGDWQIPYAQYANSGGAPPADQVPTHPGGV